MEITLDDVNGLPEPLRPLAAAADGKFKLDLTKLAPASELETYKGKALTAQQEAIDRRKALDAWKKLGETPDEIQAKLAKGADPAIVDQLRKQNEDNMTAAQQKLHAVYSRVATAELKAALSSAGVVPEGLDLLAGFASQRVKFDDEGNPVVLASDLKTPMVGSGSNGGATLADLAKELARSIPHLVADQGKGGGGKLPGQGGTPGKTITRAQFDAMGHSERAAFAKTGGKVTD